MDKLDKNVKEKRNSGLLKSSLLVSFYTGLSRIAGLLRDIVFARCIGAEALADVFFVAFKIPNFFRRILLKALSLKPLCQFWESIEKIDLKMRSNHS